MKTLSVLLPLIGLLTILYGIFLYDGHLPLAILGLLPVTIGLTLPSFKKNNYLF